MMICYQTGAVAENVAQMESELFVSEKAEDGQRRVAGTAA